MTQNPYRSPGQSADVVLAAAKRREFCFSGQLTYEDVYGRRRPRSRFETVQGVLSLIGLLMVAGLFAIQLFHQGWGGVFVSVQKFLSDPVVALLFAVVLPLAIFVAWSKRALAKQVEEGAGQFGNLEYKVDEGGIAVNDHQSSANYIWQTLEIQDISPSRATLKFKPPGNGDVIFLDRWFSDPELWAEFCRFLQEMVETGQDA